MVSAAVTAQMTRVVVVLNLARVVATINVALRLFWMLAVFVEAVEFLRTLVIAMEIPSIARASAAVVPLIWVAVVVSQDQVAVTTSAARVP